MSVINEILEAFQEELLELSRNKEDQEAAENLLVSLDYSRILN